MSREVVVGVYAEMILMVEIMLLLLLLLKLSGEGYCSRDCTCIFTIITNDCNTIQAILITTLFHH